MAAVTVLADLMVSMNCSCFLRQSNFFFNSAAFYSVCVCVRVCVCACGVCVCACVCVCVHAV